MAGFCLRHVKDKFPCLDAHRCMQTTSPIGTVYDFIRKNDQGSASLIFPAQDFLELVVSILKFMDANIGITRHWARARTRLIEMITPHAEKSGRIFCGCKDKDHSKKLTTIVVSKLVSVFLGNYARTQSELVDVPKTHDKPLSRKLFKL